ncbi:MAG: InlB B-repeat-containing protein [Candidatus Enteromonas sp.]|nr:InlB B-repeat-containing protein [Candidatus Enteromonas sp.]
MKRMNWMKKGALLLLTASLMSCGGKFFGGEDEVAISDVAAYVDNMTGATIITITFTDEEKAPLVFTIPQGVAGRDGVSISEVTSTVSEDGKSVTLHIVFSDTNYPPVDIQIPIIEGKGISDIQVGENEQGDVTMDIHYTDGTSTGPIPIPSGKDGKDGNGIDHIEATAPDHDGVITVTVYFTNGTSESFEIQNGKDGSSISSLSVNKEKSTGKDYVIEVKLTDGSIVTLRLEKPQATIWFAGLGEPKESNTKGAKAGDFYLDKLSGNVYQYNGTTWEFVFCMKSSGSASEAVHHMVTFDAGDGYALVEEKQVKYWYMEVKEGQTVDLSSIEIPTLEGYVFDGWFTDPTNVNSGQFTDMTIVTKKLNLKAKYHPVA